MMGWLLKKLMPLDKPKHLLEVEALIQQAEAEYHQAVRDHASDSTLLRLASRCLGMNEACGVLYDVEVKRLGG